MLKGPDRSKSYNAVYGVVFLFFPLVPLACVHVVERGGRPYAITTLRFAWRWVLLVWLAWSSGLGTMVVLFLLATHLGPGPAGSVPLLLGCLLVTAGGLAFATAAHRRSQRIRRAVGLHAGGTSDPADWLAESLRDAPPPARFGAPVLRAPATYEAAVGPLLAEGRAREAMWAARLCTALEDRIRGESLTDVILATPSVRVVLLERPAQGDAFGPPLAELGYWGEDGTRRIE